jgi:hypothetical protein
MLGRLKERGERKANVLQPNWVGRQLPACSQERGANRAGHKLDGRTSLVYLLCRKGVCCLRMCRPIKEHRGLKRPDGFPFNPSERPFISFSGNSVHSTGEFRQIVTYFHLCLCSCRPFFSSCHGTNTLKNIAWLLRRILLVTRRLCVSGRVPGVPPWSQLH